MATTLRSLGRGLAGAAATALVAGCAFTDPQVAHEVARPKTEPVRNLTSFSESLRCMDNLLLAFGRRGIIVTSQGIPDATGEISTGTKEMLISAVSRMSQRSGAFTFVDYDQTQFDINALQSLIPISPNFVVPDYYLRGAITQLDQNVTSETVGGGLSLEAGDFGIDAGAQADQILSVVSLDLNVGDLLTRQIIPGMAAHNSITVARNGVGGDAGATIDTVGVSFNIALNRSEGMHQAVRTLVELSAIESLGKLAQVPYWRCLQIDQTNPAIMAEVRGFYDRMDAKERVTFVQRALAGKGYHTGRINGAFDDETRSAVARYQQENGLIATGRVDFDLYAALLADDLALHRAPAEVDPGPAVREAAYTPPPALPPSLQLTSDQGRSPVYRVNDDLDLTVQVSQDAYVYCYYRDARGNVARIFPNRGQPDPYLAASRPLRVPSPTAPFEIVFDRPDVREEIACLASHQELGLRLPERLKTEDLVPMPVASLEDVVLAYRKLDRGVAEARLPIQVVN